MRVVLSTARPRSRAPSSTGLSTALAFDEERCAEHQPFLISWVSSVTWS